MTEYKNGCANDKWIVEEIYRGMRGGFFVEAGAGNGVEGSCTLVLERDYGWSGIGVEVNPSGYKRLQERRTCKTDNRALYSESGLALEFVRIRGQVGLSGLEKHLRGSTKRLAEGLGPRAEHLTVETVSLHDLFEQHGAPEIIHYVALDVEGAEPEILRTFPFDRPRKILALSIEGPRCGDTLQAHGYRAVKNPHTDQTFEHYYLHPDFERLAAIQPS
jgi:FkbM family methyltransferase